VTRTIRARALLYPCLALFAGPLAAQTVVPASLSLERAREIARTSNPGFLQLRNDEALADWDVRQAWGALLPQASANTSVSWQGAGEQQFGSVTLGDLGFGGQPSYYFSSYGINLGWSIDLATYLGPGQSKASRRTTLAQIDVAEEGLLTEVTAAYIELLRRQEGVRIAEQELENAEFNLRLAQGQLEVGSVTPIDVGQAEIQVGRSEVAALQARNLFATSRMRLLQLLGLPVQQEFEPSTSFELIQPTWELETLTEMAFSDNPELVARRLSREAADYEVRSARSAYFPTLSISTRWSGFTREASSTEFQLAQAQARVQSSISSCIRTNDLYARLADPLPPIDCTQFAFTDAQRNAIISANDQFPFSFERSPANLSLSLSIPIFPGLTRERNVEAARLQQQDLGEQVREQELALQADLAIELANARTLYESALLEQRNRELAEQQLDLARERYQLGAITFVELMDAQTLLAQAEADRINAVFAYHDSVTNLEALVGTSLRF
jgi:outer membrane protein